MLALIAGSGALPGIVVSALEQDAQPFRICELDGFPSEARGDRPMIRFRVETLGRFLRDLGEMGVSEVCFAGAIGRPKLDPSAIDPLTMPLVPRMMAALQAGDDAALRTVMSFFEEAGISVQAAHDLVPDLLPKAGILSETQPTDQDLKDIERGQEILRAMGTADVGQACVVARGQALAVEAIGGTDWMLRSLAPRQDGVGRDPELPDGGLLLKASKPNQDRRIDMPTIGTDTFVRAASVGVRGVVIEAGGVQVLNYSECVALANRLGLLFWVRE